MLRLLLPIFLFFYCIVYSCLAETVAVATERAYSITSVNIGFEGNYKNGLWTPIAVEFDAPTIEGTKLIVQCSDSDGTPITYHHEIGGQKVTVLAKLGRKDEPIRIGSNFGTPPNNSLWHWKLYAPPPPVNAERPIYLIIGNDDIGLQGAVAELMLREDRRPLLVKLNSLADLPDKWFGYEAIEMVVLTTTQPQLFEGLTAESPQIQALNDWVKLGGKMLLCVGKDAEPFLGNSNEGGEDGFLRLFFPGQFDGMTELRSGTPLERFVNSQRQIFMNGTDEAPFMRVPRMTEPRGIVFVRDGDLPLVLRTAHGLGTIIYFGGDLSERPLSNWRDRVTLVRNMMQWNTPSRGAVDPRAGAMLQLGYNDISGQIRSALDQFEGVYVIPFSVILIILTAYWLVIGLFDWFLVHKVLKRPILTWVTFPLWIVVFCVLTYALASPGRPTEERRNMLYIADVDYETGVLRDTVWESVYSPIDAQYHLHHDAWGSIGYLSWNGLPGIGLGGMAPTTVSPTVWQVGSEQITYKDIGNVPIQTRSTKSFFGQYYTGSFPDNEFYRIHSQLSDEEGVPVGTIEIPDGFSFRLKNSILVYGRWVFDLGELQPGQTIRLTRTTFTNTTPTGTTTTAVPRRDLRDLLIPPKTLENENFRGMATYNPQSTDLEYIVRVMSLHRALGGYESTGLHHAYQPSLDMSNLLTADRMLLLGVIVSDTPSQMQFFRQSFPITLTPTSPRLPRERNDPMGGDALDDPTRAGLIQQDREWNR
ncbi:MAG: hypothetical protein FWE95_07080 [Planctomycetaceae bacterium]|nr:hypothetical protein [Planctomycetaceae bacterium]